MSISAPNRAELVCSGSGACDGRRAGDEGQQAGFWRAGEAHGGVGGGAQTGGNVQPHVGAPAGGAAGAGAVEGAVGDEGAVAGEAELAAVGVAGEDEVVAVGGERRRGRAVPASG